MACSALWKHKASESNPRKPASNPVQHPQGSPSSLSQALEQAMAMAGAEPYPALIVHEI